MKQKHIGVSSIRLCTAETLRNMESPCIVTDHGEPIAAVVPMSLYLAWQAALTTERPSVFALIRTIHANALGHGATVERCRVWPCGVVGTNHPSVPWDQEEIDRAKKCGDPIAPGECSLCGEVHQP